LIVIEFEVAEVPQRAMIERSNLRNFNFIIVHVELAEQSEEGAITSIEEHYVDFLRDFNFVVDWPYLNDVLA